MAFLEPVKPSSCTTKPVELCGAKLHPMAILAYPVDCDCLCHLLDTHYCCLYLNGSLNPPSAFHPPHHLPPYTFARAIGDFTVAVKKAAQNPAVLAS